MDDTAAAAARPSRRRQYLEMMHHRAMHQVNECLNVCLLSPRSEDKWTCVARDKRRHFELFAKKSNTTQSVFFLGMNEIHCGFDEVYALLNYQSTAQFRLVMQLLYGRNFRDGALLSSHAPRDYDDDYDVADVQHSALWFTLQATRESLVGKDNSLAFFQALMVLHPDRFGPGATNFTLNNATTNGGSSQSDTLANASAFARPSETVQKRTLALAWLPFLRDTEDEDLLDQQESMRLKYTLIVEEVARAKLKLSCVAMSFRDGDDLHQSRSSAAARTIAQRLVRRSLLRLESAIIAARISRQTIVLPHQWVKNEDRVKCVICWKPFHALIRRRHHCRLCGEVVCGACGALRSTNVLSGDKKRLEKVRVCHMCSNRVGQGRSNSTRRLHAQSRHSDSYNSQSHAKIGSGGTSSTMDSIVVVGGGTATRVPLLEPPQGRRGDLGESDDDDDDFHGPDHDTLDSATAGTGYFGYIGAIMGAAVASVTTARTNSSKGDKLISLRSMTRAELVARSTSASSASRASSTSSAANRRRPPSTSTIRCRLPPALAQRSPPPKYIGRARMGQQQPHRAAPFFGAVPFRERRPPSPLSGGSMSRSFLHPSVSLPDRFDDVNGPMSIVADVGSHDRMSTAANAASHERPSSVSIAGPQATASKQDESPPARFDPLRRTSMMSIAMLDGFRTSESEGKVTGGGTVTIGAAGAVATATSSQAQLDAVLEIRRLKLMRLICSPACTLVDRVLMRECCERAALDCGVRGAFIARVEETHVVLEHVVGTATLSAIDHFLRADTPCDFVLVTPPTSERPFCISDCLSDPRTSAMVMVKDVGMRFFAGISICVRGLPIACLCVFSEGDDADDHETLRLSRLSATQYEFHVLEAAGQRISQELERLVHGMEIA